LTQVKITKMEYLLESNISKQQLVLTEYHYYPNIHFNQCTLDYSFEGVSMLFLMHGRVPNQASTLFLSRLPIVNLKFHRQVGNQRA
jgi:hypothetical protein